MNEKRARIHHKHLQGSQRFDFLREFVYGGVDGVVTTFAVVAGATGAQFDSAIIIVLGLANLFADGFSMSIGSYLSAKSERERYQKYQRYEQWGVEHIPEIETDEIRRIYQAKGLHGDLLNQVVATITADKDLWVDEMMQGEFQLVKDEKSPTTAAFYTFLSFLLVGSLPILPFFSSHWGWIQIQDPFFVTCVVTAGAFAGIGIVKALINHTSLIWGLLETLFLGASAAVLAYYTGYTLEALL